MNESLAAHDNNRFSAGPLFKANRVAIDSDLLEYMEQEKEQEGVRIRNASVSKHTNEFLTNQKQAVEVLASSKKPEVMMKSEPNTLVK